MDQREWEAFHDVDLSQWQVIDGARVIATGIDSPEEARAMSAAPLMLLTLRRVRDYFRCTRSGREWVSAGGTELTEVLKAIEKAETGLPTDDED